MALNALLDSFCHDHKSVGLKVLMSSYIIIINNNDDDNNNNNNNLDSPPVGV